MINTEAVMRKQTVYVKEKADKSKTLSFADTKDLQSFLERESAKFVFSPVPHHK